MLKRSVITIAIAVVVMMGVSAFWSAETTKLDGDTDANILASNGSPTGSSSGKIGSGIGRIIAAPFKAIGHLFGGNKNAVKLERLKEKDVANFETVGTTRIDDARSEATVAPSASTDAREHLNHGKSLLQAGRLNEAISELSLAASLDGGMAEAQNLLGVAFDKKGMPENAQNAYEKAVKLSPKDAQLLNNLGFSLYQNGNYRASIDKLKKAAKLAPSDDRIQNNLGLALARSGKYDDAYKAFAKAEGEYTANLNTATMLERAGREGDAIKYYEGARQIQPNSTAALRRLADLYQRNGRTDDADQAKRQMSEVASK